VTKMESLLDFSLEYEKLGWFVLPAESIKKKPFVLWGHRRHRRPNPNEIHGWWKRWPNPRIAIATGAYSGFDVVDVDGPEALETVIAICGGVPGTIYQTTGRPEGGRHLFFKHYEHGLKNHSDGFLDLRTTNGIIIAAPSPHKSGRLYTFGEINPIEHGLNDLAEWPPELIEYFRNARKSKKTPKGKGKPISTAPVPPGERHDALVSIVGSWISLGWDDESIFLCARKWWERLPDKADFPIEEVIATAQDLITRYRRPPAAAEDATHEKEKQADALIRIGKTAELFKIPDGTLWARFQTAGHFECWPIRSKGSGFRRWLVCTYLKENNSAPSSTALQAALEGLEAEAQFGVTKKTRQVFTRVAEHEGSIYLDLADEAWRAVRISAAGWEVVNNPPVCFRRSNGMLPLPEPQPGGSLRLLDNLVNLGTEKDRKLILSWLVFTLNPSGPYPLLGFISEQGSGKSTTAKILRMIVDPNQAPIRGLPKNTEDLAVTGQHSWILGFDNLSHIPETMADALCRMATGGGFATRALYTNDEEAIFWSKRPIILNGISEFIDRPDLHERTLIVNLPPIPPNKRLTDSDIDERFKQSHPALLGAVLDAVVLVLRNLPNVTLSKIPRMADHAKWTVAAELAISASAGEMVPLLFEKQNEALLSQLDSPISRAILDLLDERDGKIEMIVGDLLYHLNRFVTEDVRRQKSWPDGPRDLSGALARITPVMRAVGVEITFLKHTNRGRPVLIKGDGLWPLSDGYPGKVTDDDGRSSPPNPLKTEEK
jgi:hypothetical protein